MDEKTSFDINLTLIITHIKKSHQRTSNLLHYNCCYMYAHYSELISDI